MILDETRFDVRLARDEDEIRASQRLRYEVFVEERGGDGPLVDHEARLEKDRFDPFYDHLLLFDRAGDRVVGVYRLLPGDRRAEAGQFYSEDEYDLAPLLTSGRSLIELGRSCLHRDFRGGVALYRLWSGLAEYVARSGAEILFGVASFHGTDVRNLAEPLSYLHHRHLAPEDLRVRAREEVYQPMNLLAPDEFERTRAMKRIPALIKAYLRLGGFVAMARSSITGSTPPTSASSWTRSA